jgi:hypothetical protein
VTAVQQQFGALVATAGDHKENGAGVPHGPGCGELRFCFDDGDPGCGAAALLDMLTAIT